MWQGATCSPTLGFEQVWGASAGRQQSSVDDDAAYKAWWADNRRELVAPEEWASARAVQVW